MLSMSLPIPLLLAMRGMEAKASWKRDPYKPFKKQGKNENKILVKKLPTDRRLQSLEKTLEK